MSQCAPIPEDEVQRLQALSSSQMLDSPPELAVDDFTLLASQICHTPIALVSLIDDHRQWFKSRSGSPQKRLLGKWRFARMLP